MQALALEFCTFLEGKTIIVKTLWELLDKSVSINVFLLVPVFHKHLVAP